VQIEYPLGLEEEDHPRDQHLNPEPQYVRLHQSNENPQQRHEVEEIPERYLLGERGVETQPKEHHLPHNVL